MRPAWAGCDVKPAKITTSWARLETVSVENAVGRARELGARSLSRILRDEIVAAGVDAQTASTAVYTLSKHARCSICRNCNLVHHAAARGIATTNTHAPLQRPSDTLRDAAGNFTVRGDHRALRRNECLGRWVILLAIFHDAR